MEPTITIEMDGGPYDGQTHTLGPPAAKTPGTPDLAIFGVPLHPTDTPGHYKVRWSELEEHRDRSVHVIGSLMAKAEMIQKILDGMDDG